MEVWEISAPFLWFISIPCGTNLPSELSNNMKSDGNDFRDEDLELVGM